MQLNLPKKVFLVLLAIIFCLLLLNLIAFLSAYSGRIHYNDFLFQKVNFDEEKNLPSIFSSLLHLTSSILLALIGFSKVKIKKNRIFWFSLSFLFLFVAFDELLRIHEMAGRNLSHIINTTGIFHYSWIIPYGVAVITIGFIFLKPILELPQKTRNKFVLAAIIFLSGAVGMEMATGWLITSNGLEKAQLIIRPEFFLMYTVEELLEMIGVSYFIFALLEFRKENQIKSLA